MGNTINAAKSTLDFQTKIDKTKERMKTSGCLALAAGATIVGADKIGSAILKSQPKQDKFVKIIDKTAQKAGKGLAELFPKLKPTLKKIGKKFAELPGWAKVVGAIGAPAFLILDHICAKINYKNGKIDQKYEDIAKLKNKATQTLE